MYQLGKLHAIWKNSIICPIFKKVDPTLPSNYRPISITFNVRRVFERIIAEQLLFYLKSNELITEHKYGFLENRST